MIIHAAILTRVNYLKMLHVQLDPAVIFKLAGQSLQAQCAVFLSMNVIYQNIALDQVNFVQMMCLKLTVLLVKLDKPFVMKELVVHIPISVNYFGVLQEKSLIISVMNKTEKEQDMATVVIIE